MSDFSPNYSRQCYHILEDYSGLLAATMVIANISLISMTN